MGGNQNLSSIKHLLPKLCPEVAGVDVEVKTVGVKLHLTHLENAVSDAMVGSRCPGNNVPSTSGEIVVARRIIPTCGLSKEKEGALPTA